MNQRDAPGFLRKRTSDKRENDLIKVETKTLISYFRSKEDIYKYFTEQQQYFLPSYRGCPILFLKQILSLEKKVFKIQEVKHFQVPFFEEDMQVMKYMPDLDDNQLPERDFFFGIIGTIHGEWLKKVIDEALKKRNTKGQEEEKGEFVMVGDHFFNEIKNSYFLSKKPGKGLYLLQKKSLQRKMLRPRKKYDLAEEPTISSISQSTQRRNLGSNQMASTAVMTSQDRISLSGAIDSDMTQP